jgi:hypothetical protein
MHMTMTSWIRSNAVLLAVSRASRSIVDATLWAEAQAEAVLLKDIAGVEALVVIVNNQLELSNAPELQAQLVALKQTLVDDLELLRSP